MSDRSTILIADDHEDALLAYSLILKSEGYDVLSATTGEDCLRIARENRPDLILLDVRLPDISGVDVCKRIKTDSELATIFVVLVSGLEVSTDSQVLGLETGADGYITKPIDTRKLLAQIKAMLRIGENVETTIADTQRKEIARLSEFASQSRTPVTAQLYGVRPLRQSFHDIFNQMVQQYASVLELALEQQAYKINNRVTESLQEIVEQLGFLNAGPRDVVDLHSTALKMRLTDATAKKARAYINEGRMRLVEMMGHLVTYYRSRSLGASAINTSRNRAQTEGADH